MTKEATLDAILESTLETAIEALLPSRPADSIAKGLTIMSGMYNDAVYILEGSDIGFLPGYVMAGYVDLISYEQYPKIFPKGFHDFYEPTPDGYYEWFQIFDDSWGSYPLQVYYPQSPVIGENMVVLATVGTVSHAIDWIAGVAGLVEQKILPLWQGYLLERHPVDAVGVE